MLFKTFDIDHDKIVIDEQVTFKPDYVSVSDWMAFWEKVRSLNENPNR